MKAIRIILIFCMMSVLSLATTIPRNYVIVWAPNGTETAFYCREIAKDYYHLVSVNGTGYHYWVKRDDLKKVLVYPRRVEYIQEKP